MRKNPFRKMFEEDSKSNTHCNDPQSLGSVGCAPQKRRDQPVRSCQVFSYDDDHNDYDHDGYEILFLK